MYGEKFQIPYIYYGICSSIAKEHYECSKSGKNTEIITFSKKLHKIFSRKIANLSDSISQTERIIKFFPAHANFLHENKKTTKHIGHNMNIL